jgi:hypothetical protein
VPAWCWATAVPKLLEMLSLKSAIVTADALNCQRAIATQVVEQGGDYVLALKGNQSTLHTDVRLYLADPAHDGPWAQAAREMRVGPSGSAFRGGSQTTPGGCGREPWS